MKCPLCNEEYDVTQFEKKGTCSNCGQKINDPQKIVKAENANIRKKVIREKKYGYTKITKNTGSIFLQEDEEKKKKLDKTLEKNNDSAENSELQSSERNEEIKTNNEQNVVIPKKSAIIVAAEQTEHTVQNTEQKTANNNTEKAKPTVDLFDACEKQLSIEKELPEENNSTLGTETTDKKPKEKKLNETIQKITQLKENISGDKINKVVKVNYDFNEDGFYNDTEPLEPPQADVIPISTIIKIVAIVGGILLYTLFMIYYVASK